MTLTQYNTIYSDRSSKVLRSRGCRNVTPSDSTLADVALQLFVTGAGNLVVTGTDGNLKTVTVSAAMVAGGGYTYTSAVSAVNAATTCTGIIAYV